MDKKIARKWTEALRSGEYRQGKGTLKTKNGRYCCLGVLCDIQNIPTNGKDSLSGLDMLDIVGMSADIESELICMNDDNNCNFNEIADVIDIIIAEDMWHLTRHDS